MKGSFAGDAGMARRASRGRRAALLVLALLVASACSRFPHAVGPDEGRFVASRSGDRYHRPECPVARRIAPKNLLYYKTGDDAYADRFTPCQICHPEREKPPAAP